MDLINTENLTATREWIAGAERKRLNKRERELIALLSVLLNSCTTYLGYHGKVERGLAQFREQMIP